MPKEVIYPRQSETGDNPAPWAEVSWSKEYEHVQLVTKAADGIKLEPTPEGNGWYVDLNRTQINRLIRALRRARDDSFGKDE